MSDRHPSCIHSTGHHNSMTQGSAASACTCEECSRYKVMPSSEQTSYSSRDLEQQPTTTMSSNSASRRGGDPFSNSTSTSSSSPPTTYLARRSSTVLSGSSSGSLTGDTATSPRMMQPAGFGLTSKTMKGGIISPPQRRSSLEFHNRERSFQQHSTACDCGGSGVGCGCSFTCSC
ncbi:hypothetical protein BGX24_001560 [Mortierella sp. AD032]|nr:hypothetical protein BGX24_001560 [Mortierella sp. AD032]